MRSSVSFDHFIEGYFKVLTYHYDYSYTIWSDVLIPEYVLKYEFDAEEVKGGLPAPDTIVSAHNEVKGRPFVPDTIVMDDVEDVDGTVRNVVDDALEVHENEDEDEGTNDGLRINESRDRNADESGLNETVWFDSFRGDIVHPASEGGAILDERVRSDLLEEMERLVSTPGATTPSPYDVEVTTLIQSAQSDSTSTLRSLVPSVFKTPASGPAPDVALTPPNASSSARERLLYEKWQKAERALKISRQNVKEKETVDLDEVDEDVLDARLDEVARLREKSRLEIAEKAKEMGLGSTSKGRDSEKPNVKPTIDLDFLERITSKFRKRERENLAQVSTACAELAEERKAFQTRERERLAHELEKKERQKVKKLEAERRAQELEQKTIANKAVMKEINAKLALLSRSLLASSSFSRSVEVTSPQCELQNISGVSTFAAASVVASTVAPSNPSSVPMVQALGASPMQAPAVQRGVPSSVEALTVEGAIASPSPRQEVQVKNNSPAKKPRLVDTSSHSSHH